MVRTTNKIDESVLDKLEALEGHNSFNVEGSGDQTDDEERERSLVESQTCCGDEDAEEQLVPKAWVKELEGKIDRQRSGCGC